MWMRQAARHSETVMVGMIAQNRSLQPGKFQNQFTATRKISKSSEEDTVKQITLTATFQTILMIVLNKIMRLDVFLKTQFRTIWMLGNKDKETKEALCFIFVCFVDLTVPSICHLYHF